MINSIAQMLPLNDGCSMPGYGFGCYKIFGSELEEAIAASWKTGCRLFDTAAYYNNEEAVGKALATYAAQDFFLISKLWPTAFANSVKELDASLTRLNRDYLDCYLLHWPGTDEKAMLSAWECLLKEREKGKIRVAGVSNFLESQLEAIYEHFDHWPAVNQIEIHPEFQQKELCRFCAERHIQVMAWSPLGRGSSLGNATLASIARQCGKFPAQVVLRWHLQQNRVPIPKSAHKKRIAENADIFDFMLTELQLAQIDALEKPGGVGRRGADPMTFAG